MCVCLCLCVFVFVCVLGFGFVFVFVFVCVCVSVFVVVFVFVFVFVFVCVCVCVCVWVWGCSGCGFRGRLLGFFFVLGFRLGSFIVVENRSEASSPNSSLLPDLSVLRVGAPTLAPAGG